MKTPHEEKQEPGASDVELADNKSPAIDAYHENGDEIYQRFSRRKKIIIACVVSYCAFLAPISSTTPLAAIQEISDTYDTTVELIEISNALYMLFMGVSPMFWGPMGQLYGRKIAFLASTFLFAICSIGTALAPDLASFYIFRILTAFQGTAFLILGQSCIADLYRPVERATALAFFLTGTLVGPALGPFIAGVIVTYVNWRNIFWLQTALGGAAFLLVLLLLPETIHSKKAVEMHGLSKSQYAKHLWSHLNPWRVVALFRYPNLIAVSLASSSLVWNMYSLLSALRFVLNPRFNLITPMQAAYFYLAPGAGYIVGTFFGGRWADRVVKRYIDKRGERIPEDRLRSCIPFLGGVIPACMLVYGWSVEKEVGGVALPIIAMFLQGVAQLFCFPSLNTYCLDVKKSRAAEVTAGNYMIRYLFAAAATAAVVPGIKGIGVGLMSTISALFLCLSAGLTYLAAIRGREWREKVDRKRHLSDSES